MTADPKPAKRIRDSGASLRKLMQEPGCRAGCGRTATDGHHILLRSQGGDDVEDNILPLCHACHMAYHAGNLKRELNFRGVEVGYVQNKLGQIAGEDYLLRRYGFIWK